MTVRRVLQEAGAQGLHRLLDAAAQQVEGTDALAYGCGSPAFEPTVSRLRTVGHLDPRLVYQQVELGIVGVEIAVEHGFKIKLDVGLAGQAGRVAQQPQQPAVGDQSPQVGVGAVQQFLQQGMRCALRGAGDAGRAAIERYAHPSRCMGVVPHRWLTGYERSSTAKPPGPVGGTRP